MRWWLSLLFLFPFPASAGGGCTDVDLRERLGPPMHQGDSGYCFAHSSSSLIQAKLGVRVSPMQLAAGYLLATPDELRGAADEAVKARLTPAFFEMWRHDRLEEPQNYAPNKILTENGLLNTGGDELQTLVVANFLGLCDESRLPTGRSVYKKYLKDIVAYHEYRMQHGPAPAMTEMPIGEITDPEARAKAWSFRLWVENHCGSPMQARLPLAPTEITLAKNLKSFRRLQAMHLATALEQNRIMQAVDEQLSRGNVVAIGYALADIMPGEAAVQGPNPSPADVDHASVFAGRRSQGGRCYYYLRNSFGRESAGYAPRFKGRVENGGVWVLPEEIPSLYSAIWLE